MPVHQSPLAAIGVTLAAPWALALVVAAGQGPVANDRGAPWPRQLVVLDRQGNTLGILGEPGDYINPVLSPDGTKVAVVRTTGLLVSENEVASDVWVFDVATGARTRVTFDPEIGEKAPVWSPDGSQIAYFAFRDEFGGLYRKAADGTGREELLFRERGVDMPLTDWSPDGRFLSFSAGSALWTVPVDGSQTSLDLLREEYRTDGVRFSPDGRFVAYVSNESGRAEVYVRALDPSTGLPPRSGWPVTGGQWQVSTDGGLGLIQWRQDGRELYYLDSDGGLMAVEITTTPAFLPGRPTLLFTAPPGFDFEDTNSAVGFRGDCSCDLDACEQASISRDGQRFVFAVQASGPRAEVSVAAKVLARYVGVYAAADEADEVVVAVEDNHLMVTLRGQARPFAAMSDIAFFRGSDTLEFVQDPRGAVTGMTLRSGLAVDRFRRR